MAFVVGVASDADIEELKSRGWTVGDVDDCLGDEPVEAGEKYISVYVDNDLIDIMSGPDWGTSHADGT